jgi:hypothetical protein
MLPKGVETVTQTERWILLLVVFAALLIVPAVARIAWLERVTPCRYEYFPCQRAECVTEVAGSCAGYVLRDEICHRCVEERP